MGNIREIQILKKQVEHGLFLKNPETLLWKAMAEG